MSFPVLKGFSHEIGGDNKKFDFIKHSTRKYVNIWKICVTQWINVFPMMLEDHAWVKSRTGQWMLLQQSTTAHWYDFRFHRATNLPETFTCSCAEPEMNDHNYLKRLLKYSLFPTTCGFSSSSSSTKTTMQHVEGRSMQENQAVFY